MSFIITLKSMRNRLIQLPNKSKVMIGILLICIGFSLIFLLATKYHHSQLTPVTSEHGINTTTMETSEERLNQVAIKLSTLVTKITLHDRILTTLNQQIQRQSQLVESLKNNQSQLITQTNFDAYKISATENSKKLEASLTSLQAQVNHLTEKLSPPHYLSANALPFRIDSVDLWNGLPYVAITEHQQHGLLGLGDNQAGWTLTHLNVQDKTAIFKNAKQQQVYVQLSAH